MTTQSGDHSTVTTPFDQKRLGRLVVGVVSLALSIGYLIEALGMPRGSIDSPGPGMFPVGVGLAAVVVSLIVIVEGLTGAGTRGSLELPVGFERRKVLTFMGSLIGFILILPLAGMYVSAALYVVATLRFLGRLSWVRAAIVGVIMAVAVTWIFQEILEVPLPSGLW